MTNGLRKFIRIAFYGSCEDCVFDTEKEDSHLCGRSLGCAWALVRKENE